MYKFQLEQLQHSLNYISNIQFQVPGLKKNKMFHMQQDHYNLYGIFLPQIKLQICIKIDYKQAHLFS